MIQNWLNSAAIIGIAAYLAKEYLDRRQRQQREAEVVQSILDGFTEAEDGTICYSMKSPDSEKTPGAPNVKALYSQAKSAQQAAKEAWKRFKREGTHESLRAAAESANAAAEEAIAANEFHLKMDEEE